MAAAGRRPQGQVNGGATRAGAGAGSPGVARGRSGLGGATTQGAGERREAGEEAVTGLEQRGSGSGNGGAPDPARPARRGAALQAVISLATRPARGDNGPPNRRCRETNVATPTNGRGLAPAAPGAAGLAELCPAVPGLCFCTPASRMFI